MLGVFERKNRLVIRVSEIDNATINTIKELGGNHPGILIQQGEKFDRQSTIIPHEELIGGIQVHNGETFGYSTLSFPVLDENNNKAIVVSGHAFFNQNIGDNVYQPSDSSDPIGVLKENPKGSWFNHRKSDAALVSIDNRTLTGKIYHEWENYKNIGGVVDDLSQHVPGADLAMYGKESGTQYGVIYEADIDFICNLYGKIESQVKADYYSQGGDSGAPITQRYPVNDEFFLTGIHLGIADDGYKIYSPYCGIENDLNINRPVWHFETIN